MSRPKGSKNKPKTDTPPIPKTPGKRGRKPGTKNKSKEETPPVEEKKRESKSWTQKLQDNVDKQNATKQESSLVKEDEIKGIGVTEKENGKQTDISETSKQNLKPQMPKGLTLIQQLDWREKQLK